MLTGFKKAPLHGQRSSKQLLVEETQTSSRSVKRKFSVICGAASKLCKEFQVCSLGKSSLGLGSAFESSLLLQGAPVNAFTHQAGLVPFLQWSVVSSLSRMRRHYMCRATPEVSHTADEKVGNTWNFVMRMCGENWVLIQSTPVSIWNYIHTRIMGLLLQFPFITSTKYL